MKKIVRNKKIHDFTDLFAAFYALEVFAREGSLCFEDMIVLLWLQSAGKSSAGVISAALGLSPSKTTRCLKMLTSFALVEETLDAKDLRKCFFRISSKGSNIAYEVAGVFGDTLIKKQIAYVSELKRALHKAEAMLGCKVTDTAQRLLLVLYEAPHPLSVNQLCEDTSLSQSRVSMSLKGLKRINLLENKEMLSDLRMRACSLSEKGFAVSSAMIEEISIPSINSGNKGK